jgi:glycerate 2-kinase
LNRKDPKDAKNFSLAAIDQMRRHVVDIFNAGLEPVMPEVAVKRFCSLDGSCFIVGDQEYDLSLYQHVYVVGAGKASAAMAAAVEDILGHRVSGGSINVKYGHVCRLEHVALNEAGHPVPDDQGEAGAHTIRRLLAGAGEQDLVLCLLSGGGSALLPLPEDSLTLADKQATIQVLLACGATIHEINTIRKHTSRIKGGWLARAAYPATVVSLIISDVVGDNLDIIASGPTVPDPGTFEDCMAIVRKYNIEDRLPPMVMQCLAQGAVGKREETPKPGEPVFEKVQNLIVAGNREALSAAKVKAESLGYNTLVLSAMFEGETRDVARFHASIAQEVAVSGHPISAPACILSGGETTVTLSGTGLGGRNQEFVLACVPLLEGLDNMVLMSAGTDGTDGPTDAAGAIMDGMTGECARQKGMDAVAYLENNDAYHYFNQLGDLFKPGPTQTNVMDLRIMLIGEKM